MSIVCEGRFTRAKAGGRRITAFGKAAFSEITAPRNRGTRWRSNSGPSALPAENPGGDARVGLDFLFEVGSKWRPLSSAETGSPLVGNHLAIAG